MWRNPFLRIVVFSLCMAAILVLAGCASSPEKRAAKEQRRITEKQNKAAEEQNRRRQTFAGYTDEQLRYKFAACQEAVNRGTEGMNILLKEGNGFGVLIAQGQIEAKVKERDEIGLELARRGAASTGRAPKMVPAESDPTEIKGFGSGCFITDDGYFLTCAHVVKDATKIVVHTKNGNFPAKPIREDAANDLAILKVDGSFPALPLVSSSPTKLGETVFTIGFPRPTMQGFAPKYTRGEISSLSGGRDDPREFQISVPVQPGNSGSPLVNQNGAVIGVVTSKLDDIVALKRSGSLPENVNYAVKSSYALLLFESLPDAAGKLRVPLADQERKQEDVIKEVEDATALVICY